MSEVAERPSVNVGSNEDFWWGQVEVVRAGVTFDGKACFWLRGESGGIKVGAWFYGDSPEMAQVGLEAITNGKKAEVGLEDHKANSKVNVILLVP
ncbi:hypothetical protein ACIGJO_31865 [Streptomyces sp. NPDC079020]|uniref:hypothetical protein n=1 Tax=Streptomyces sp. NPDC079020 TaxID=3365722 RepID=UPI0037CDDD6D